MSFPSKFTSFDQSILAKISLLILDEVEYIELKLRLGKMLRECRAQSNITQVELAKAISSSQSRVAKMEKGDPSVTVDLQIRSLFAMGLKRRNLAEELCRDPEKVLA